MRTFKLDSIGKKLGLFISLIIVGALLSISVFNYIISRNEIAKSNRIILENAIETVMSDINSNYSYAHAGEGSMSEEEAKEASINAVKRLQKNQADTVSTATTEAADAASSATANSEFSNHTLNLGESGYFFIINSQGDIISHPFLEDNIYELKAKDGRWIVQDIVELAKKGGGILNYALEGDVSVIRDSKTVYSMYFPHWDWVVCAVIYDIDFYQGANMILLSNMISVGIMLVISLALAMLISNRITGPIKKISETLREVSQGNLTQSKIEVKTRDETRLLADSVNRLLDSFNDIVKTMTISSGGLHQFAMNLTQSSGVVSEATVEVAKAIAHMASLTEDQYRETLDTVQRITQLGEDIEYTAQEGMRIEEAAQRSLEWKEEGAASVHHLKEANEENQTNSSEIETIIHKINDASQDIGMITEIITRVAKQTNLLALNASIEASRAGEHGSGFSVVAEEIRKLASETGAATENIRERIEQMQMQSEEAVRFISINRAGVERINSSVLRTEDVIGRIEEGLMLQIQGIQEIARRNKEINAKKDEIQGMLQNVAASAEENSASAQEISASAEEQSVTLIEITDSITQLYDMVQGLNELIKKFRTN